MDRDNTIARLENIAKHAVHTAGEDIFILNLDDGIAIHEAIEALKAQLSHESTTSDLISKFIDGLEEIFAYIREREGGDSVCGLCEYDGAYIGESGDWCNECPGFNRDDCFKLSDETRKKWTEEIINALPTIQPERQKGEWIDYTEDGYVECPFCHSATNCDGNKDELHFCFSCGADMRGEQDERG